MFYIVCFYLDTWGLSKK